MNQYVDFNKKCILNFNIYCLMSFSKDFKVILMKINSVNLRKKCSLFASYAEG